MDISNFYLCSPLGKPEYMRMPIKLTQNEIIDKYNLKRFEHDGWVYIKIVKGMYGLPQAGKIANELLQQRLKCMDIILCNSRQACGLMFGYQLSLLWQWMDLGSSSKACNTQTI